MYSNQADCQTVELSSTYHPCGMLDRDQRTTKMLPKSFKYNSNSKLHQTQIFNNSQNIVIKRNSQNNNNFNKKWCSHNTSNHQSVNTNQINGDNQKIKSVLVASKTNCKNNMHCHLSTLNDDCGNMINQYPVFNKTKFTRCKSISKLSNLLICVCFWLLIMQKTRARPTNGNYAIIFDHVHDVVQQNFDLNLDVFQNYSDKYLGENSTQFWKKADFTSLSKNNTQKHFIFHDYKDGSDVDMNVTDEASAIEALKNISRSAMILHAASNYITEKDRVDKFNMTYYTQFNKTIGQLKTEIESVFRKLEITTPVFVPLDMGKSDKEVRDLVLLREHLKLMTYIKKVYPALRNIYFNGK